MRPLVDLVRGVLIGLAEVVPGVSGGTIALILGIYRALIDSAAAAFRLRLREVRWRLVIPVLIGMGTAIILGAAVLEPLLEEYPTQTRAVFLGLVLVGISVPARMVRAIAPWVGRDLLLLLPAAAVAFVLVGLPPGEISDPSTIVILASAAVAVCALVLPGVSGSFLLLSLGMYELTIAAVNDRDLAYLATFALGALIGLGLFVQVLRWLLAEHARVTLVLLTGLMVGSLRALWPWQDADRGLLAPESLSDLLGALVLAGAGAGIVLLLLAAERRLAPLLGADAAEVATRD